VARAADVRGGIEDDGAGSHTPVRSRADHRTTPVVDRLHLPFAAVAFSAVVSLMPGFFLFNAATGLVELVSIGPSAPAALLTSIATSGPTAVLIIIAMTFGLILPRMLFERVLPAPA
jgi:hypothetical protein